MFKKKKTKLETSYELDLVNKACSLGELDLPSEYGSYITIRLRHIYHTTNNYLIKQS